MRLRDLACGAWIGAVCALLWPGWIPGAEAQWQPERGLVLVGTAVTMNNQDEVIPRARLFIRNGKIQAIARTGEALPPEADQAVVVESTGFIYPGLIDLHNHPEYNVFPLWVVPEQYKDRYQWRNRKAYKAVVAEPYKMLSAKEYLNLQAELGKYAELKALVGGTTAIQGTKKHPAYSSTEYLVRNVEYTDVGAKPVRGLLDPPRNEAGWVKARNTAAGAGAWFFHLAEGFSSPKTRREFGLLRTHGLVRAQLVAIHSVDVSPQEFGELGAVGAKMVWSPLSNYLLYSQTADIRSAKAARVLISLAPDWSPSGSKSILGELKVADLLNRTKLMGLFSDRELVQMVTRNPAKALGWDAVAGQLAHEFLGDVVVVDRIDDNPYRNLILAAETHLQLVVIRGEPLYGDEALMRKVKTYREQSNGATKLVRRYEILDTGLTGPREKAVDFKKTELPKGSVAAKDVMETLTRALRFDRTALYQKIPAEQVRADLKDCKNAPPPADPPSRADFERFVKCKFPGGLRPTPLDPPFTPTDGEFFRRLDANQNLPQELKRLKDYYRSQ